MPGLLEVAITWSDNGNHNLKNLQVDRHGYNIKLKITNVKVSIHSGTKSSAISRSCRIDWSFSGPVSQQATDMYMSSHYASYQEDSTSKL